jgi:hypothetical protein
MQLLTKAIRKQAQPIGATDGDNQKKVLAKFFTPWSYWTWYAVEFDGDDLFFGYVEGLESEWGYFSLKDLEEIKGPFGLGVERDIMFENKVININGDVGSA